MHANLSWLKVEEKLTSSLIVFVRNFEMLNAPSCLFKLLAHSSDTHSFPTRHATRGLFTTPKSKTDYGRRTALYGGIAIWNSIPHQGTDASSRIRFKTIDKNVPYGTEGTVKRHTGIHMLNTHTHVFCIVDMWW